MTRRKWANADLAPFSIPPEQCIACGKKRVLLPVYEARYVAPETPSRAKKTEPKRITVPYLVWTCFFCGFQYVTHIKGGTDEVTEA